MARKPKPPPHPKTPGGPWTHVTLYPSHELREIIVRRARRHGRSNSKEMIALIESALAAEAADAGDPTDALEIRTRARARELGISTETARRLAEREAASGI